MPVDPPRFFIQFDRPDDFYYSPGMTVSGQLIMKLTEPYAIRCIRVLFLGKAHVEWMESTTDGSSRSFSDEEMLFEATRTLWGNRQGRAKIIPVGEYAFKFSFRIPTSRPLPGSFKGANGEVRYLVRVFIDRPGFQFTKKLEKEFFIPLPSFITDMDSRAAKPQMISDRKTFCCCWCIPGRIDVTIRLPKTGYVHGEVIALSAEIVNRSYKTVEKVTLQLVQNFKVTVNPGPSEASRTNTTVLASVTKRGPIRRGGKQSWENEELSVPTPDKAPPTVEGSRSRILEITYFIMFLISPSGYCCDFDVTLPIIIGSAPVKSLLVSPKSTSRSPGSVTSEYDKILE